MEFREIPTKKIDYGKNVRFEKNLDLGGLEDSIDEHDVIQPILVRPVNGRYEVVCGHRRFMALKDFATAIPCIVRDDINDDDLTAVQLEENIHRKDMSAKELVAAFDDIKKRKGLKTNNELAAEIHTSVAYITNQYTAVKFSKNHKIDGNLTAGRIMYARHKEERMKNRVDMNRYNFNHFEDGRVLTVNCEDKNKMLALKELLSGKLIDDVVNKLYDIQDIARHLAGTSNNHCSEIISKCKEIEYALKGVIYD